METVLLQTDKLLKMEKKLIWRINEIEEASGNPNTNWKLMILLLIESDSISL
jgi:hypothetical protein